MNGRTFPVKPIVGPFSRGVSPMDIRGVGARAKTSGAMTRIVPAAISSGYSVAPGLEAMTLGYRA